MAAAGFDADALVQTEDDIRESWTGYRWEEPEERSIDVVTAQKCYSVHHGNTFPSALRTIIIQMITEHEPQFVFNGAIARELFGESSVTLSTAETDANFQDIVRNWWIPLSHDCYDEIMIAGIVVVRYHTLPTKDVVPVVLGSHQLGNTHMITTRVDPKTTKTLFRVYKMMSADGEQLRPPQIDHEARVVSGFGWDPKPDGTLTSKISSILNFEEWMMRVFQLSLQAEYNVSRPTFVTERERDAPATDMSEIDQFADFDRRTNEGLFVRKAHDPHSTAYQKSVDPKKSAPVWLPREDRMDIRQSFVGNTLPLPPGYRVAKPVMPERNAQLADWLRKYQEVVSVTYGLPRGMFIQDVGSHVTSDPVSINRVLHRTMGMWNRHISRILTNAYRCIYHENDCNFMLGKVPVNKFPMKEEDLFKMSDTIADVQVIVSMTPTIDDMRMKIGLLEKTVTWPEYYAAARASRGLPPTAPPPAPNLADFVPPPPQTKEGPPAKPLPPAAMATSMSLQLRSKGGNI